MEELKAYICKDGKDRVILLVGGLCMAGGSCLALFHSHKTFIGIILALAAVLLLYEAITCSARESAYIRSLEDSPEGSKILADFAGAKSFADDKLRLGKTYVFRSKYAILIKASDIKSAIFYERMDHDTHKSEYGITITMQNGKMDKLCDLYGSDPYGQAHEIFSALMERNPSIEILN